MNKINQILFFLSLMVLLIFSISNVFGADIYTNGCWNNNITSNTNYYLTQDVDVSTSSNCFSSSTGIENVIIDCQGYEITQSYNHNNYQGITTNQYGVVNLTVRNCELSNWGFGGIHLWNATNITIQDNIFHDNGDNSTLFADIRLGYGYGDNNGLIIENNQFLNFSSKELGLLSLQLDQIQNLVIRNNNFSGIYNGTHYRGKAISISNQNTLETQNNYEIYGNRFENMGTNYIGSETTIIFSLTNATLFENISFYNNYFDKFIVGLYVKQAENVNVYNNNFSNMLYSSTFPSAISLNYINHSLVYGNNITNITVDSFYHGNAGIYVDDSSNMDIYDNVIDEYLGIPIYIRDNIINTSIHNNIFTNPVINGSNNGVQLRDSSDVEVYNENFYMDDYASSCIRIRGTATNNYVHDNNCENALNGILFDSSGTYTGNVITNNTLKNNIYGIEFNDLGEIITLSSNNIYSNNINVQSGNVMNISGNYYADGEVNSSEGFCLVQPYTEGNVTDYSSYCCLNGFNDGCSYTPPIVAGVYTPDYSDEDIPKATMNVIVKISILIGTFITFFVIILIMNIIKKNRLMKK